jgi:hypothetical protein
VARTESRLGMNRDYPIVGDHPLVPVLRASFDAARDFGLPDAELWCIVQAVLSDSQGDRDLSGVVDRLNAELAEAIISRERPVPRPDLKP